MPPWICQINSALQKEAENDFSRWIQLSTIGIDNTPRVRTVVFRGWSESYEMKLFTDKRSQKIHEIDLNNNVEICWLFLKCKCQFRFRGTSRIDLGKDNIHHWNQLNNKSKSMWSWPTPGERFCLEKEHVYLNRSEEELSENFALLKIHITHVDQLLLSKPKHIRRKWERNNDWNEERINP